MLQYIIKELASKIVGTDVNLSQDRNALVDLANIAAKEIYEGNDLIGCLREQVFSVDLTNATQITLPYYVKTIRGIRPYANAFSGPILLESMQPRFTTQEWNAHQRNWRFKYVSPFLRTLDAVSHLTFTLSSVESQAFQIYITGATPTSDRIVEILDVPANTSAVTSTNVWLDHPEPNAILKSGPTNFNITVTDDSGNTVAFLPNFATKAQNTVVQVTWATCGTCGDNQTPGGCAPGGCKCYEVLYKLDFLPFVNDYDEFVCPGYDDAIVWKCRELWVMDQDEDQYASKKTDIALFSQKCDNIIAKIEADAKKGMIFKAEFRRSHFANLHWWDRRMITPIRLTSGIYPVYPIGNESMLSW